MKRNLSIPDSPTSPLGGQSVAFSSSRPLDDPLFSSLSSTRFWTWLLAVAIAGFFVDAGFCQDRRTDEFIGSERVSGLRWTALPDLPNPLGIAGPFVGTHANVLMVAGGANFPQPYWESDKRWHDQIFVLRKTEGIFRWTSEGNLSRAAAYGASASTPNGLACIGGNDAESVFSECFLLQWDPAVQKVRQTRLPDFPTPIAYAAACNIGSRVYVVGGQITADLSSATNRVWTLDVGTNSNSDTWRLVGECPGPPRAFPIAVVQNNGFNDCVYVIGGRHEDGGSVRFLDDCWQFDLEEEAWHERAKLPSRLAAGTGIAYGQSNILVLSGDDGSLFSEADALGDQHPGFPKVTFGYHAITDAWTTMGASPANQVTTTAVRFDGSIVLPSGEVRPRIRSPKVWRIDLESAGGSFGIIDYIVLGVYLCALVGIGVYCSLGSQSTEEYFRGAGKIPWWAAGCSIFATMLSSLTFTGVPSKAFAQDWVLAVGNMMIPVVAGVAVWVALPFYRRLDVTSAYQYLEHRFHRSLRVFGSLSFSTFHLFRMAIVMSLTGLALAVATPLSPGQSVILMGALSIVYCSVGGVKAVIWTDTLQTVVLLGGASIAIVWMLAGTGSGLSESLAVAASHGKLNFANWQLSPTASQIALWVIVLGAIGQNTSSYTADQAVVQRYMTTRNQTMAARAIWTNALLSIPATILFFGIGTSLFLYYRMHPERLEPSITTDQIFPHFIANELPTGLAGLIVAAIFAAAQSTVSTSMNSVAATLITDCVLPVRNRLTENQLLRLARTLTVLLGVAGTWLALLFVSPEIRSLFDEFIKVIGLFMGVLGGLFVLGFLFPQANVFGAWIGVVTGTGLMIYVWLFTSIDGYLYTAIGITGCVVVGLFGSCVIPKQTIASNNASG